MRPWLGWVSKSSQGRDITCVEKNTTNTCKVQRKTRTWCSLRMARRPGLKKQEGDVPQMVHPRFLSSCLWRGQGRPSLNLGTDLAILFPGSPLFSTRVRSGLGGCGAGVGASFSIELRCREIEPWHNL